MKIAGRIPSHRALVGSGLLVALLGAVGCQSSPPTGTPPGVTPTATAAEVSPVPTGAPVDAAGAKAAIERFVGGSIDATVTGPHAAVNGPLYQVQGADVSGAVDAQSGRIISVLFFDKFPTTRLTTLSRADAEAAARAFLDAHEVSVEGLSVATALEDHGDTVHYRVTWTKTERGIELPISTIVGVDPATGAVFSYMDVRRAYLAPPDPRLTLEDAVRVSTAIAAIGRPRVETSRLRVTFGDQGAQRLVWEIGLAQPASNAHVLVEVDAITGEARIIGRG